MLTQKPMIYQNIEYVHDLFILSNEIKTFEILRCEKVNKSNFKEKQIEISVGPTHKY